MLSERKDTLVCGSSRGSETLSRLAECNDDIRTHLATYHLSQESFSKYELLSHERTTGTVMDLSNAQNDID